MAASSALPAAWLNRVGIVRRRDADGNVIQTSCMVVENLLDSPYGQQYQLSCMVTKRTN